MVNRVTNTEMLHLKDTVSKYKDKNQKRSIKAIYNFDILWKRWIFVFSY